MDYLTTEHRLQAQRLLDDIRGALRVKETQLKESDDEGKILSHNPDSNEGEPAGYSI